MNWRFQGGDHSELAYRCFDHEDTVEPSPQAETKSRFVVVNIAELEGVSKNLGERRRKKVILVKAEGCLNEEEVEEVEEHRDLVGRMTCCKICGGEFGVYASLSINFEGTAAPFGAEYGVGQLR